MFSPGAASCLPSPGWGFLGEPSCLAPPGKPAPRPHAQLPGCLTYPKSLTYGFYITWLCRRLLGCKQAYFPLSFHAALGTGCSSFSPALVLPHAARSDTSLPAPGRVQGGRGRLLPLLCPQIAAWLCQRQVGARGGAGPSLFALPSALPQVCSPPRGFLCWDVPTGWLVPGTAPKCDSFTPKCPTPPPEQGLGSVPCKATGFGQAGVLRLVLSRRAGCFGLVRAILIVLLCFCN